MIHYSSILMNLLSFNFYKEFCPQCNLSTIFEGCFDNVKELKQEKTIDKKGRVHYREDVSLCL